MSDAIVLRRVNKRFGRQVAVRDLNLTVPSGSLVGFIGPNGAGKTTALRMILSILFPDDGEITVLGQRSALEAKDRIGYLPEERGVYRKMKVGAFLRYMARLKGTAPAELGRRVARGLERVGLEAVAEKRCEELSKGMQQKVQFLAAVLHEPELLILDEPFSGLDPVNMRLLRELIDAQHRRGATVIFSTHVMVQAEQLCDRIVMIHDGVKVLDDALVDIRRRFDPRVVHFEPIDSAARPETLAALPDVEEVAAADGYWKVALRDGSDPAAAVQALVAAQPPARVELHRPTLEDVFIEIVGGDGPLPGASVEELRAALRAESAAGAEEVGA